MCKPSKKNDRSCFTSGILALGLTWQNIMVLQKAKYALQSTRIETLSSQKERVERQVGFEHHGHYCLERESESARWLNCVCKVAICLPPVSCMSLILVRAFCTKQYCYILGKARSNFASGGPDERPFCLLGGWGQMRADENGEGHNVPKSTLLNRQSRSIGYQKTSWRD